MHYRSGSRVTGLCVPVVFHIVFLIAKVGECGYRQGWRMWFGKVGECGLGCAVGRSGFSPPLPRLAVEQTFLVAVV